jgi:hypothetical protein
MRSRHELGCRLNDVVGGAQHRDERLPRGDLAAVGRRAALAGVERDLAQAELEGVFSGGGTIRMTSKDGDLVELRIAEAAEPEHFVDEADLGSVVVRTTHRAERDGDRTRIVYRMEISGPEADTLGPQLGPQISGDFPEVLRALAERAEGAS